MVSPAVNFDERASTSQIGVNRRPAAMDTDNRNDNSAHLDSSSVLEGDGSGIDMASLGKNISTPGGIEEGKAGKVTISVFYVWIEYNNHTLWLCSIFMKYWVTKYCMLKETPMMGPEKLALVTKILP